MEQTQLDSFINKHFILFNIIFSVILAGLYALKGFQNYFHIGTYLVIGMNILFIPLALIFKKKGFAIFYLCYSVILVFANSIEPTYLFNNYSALFLVCIVIMIQPKLKIPGIILYFCTCSICFLLNNESLLLFMIHIVRSIWFILIVSYILNNKFERKKLILYEDEIKILDQLATGKIYQKEVEGFSENTIYRKLKAARERNGNLTRDQLVELYKKEKEKPSSPKE